MLVYQLPQALQHFLAIVLEATIYFIDIFILHDPQSAVCLLNKPRIMTDQDNSYESEGRVCVRVEEKE